VSVFYLCSVEAARLKELPSLIKDLRLEYPKGYPYSACSILDCARFGSVTQLRIQIEAQGTQILNTEVDTVNCTALHIVAEHGFQDCVQLCIQYGADVNARSTLGATPLHYAVAK
jgi:hypothetical protein